MRFDTWRSHHSRRLRLQYIFSRQIIIVNHQKCSDIRFRWASISVDFVPVKKYTFKKQTTKDRKNTMTSCLGLIDRKFPRVRCVHDGGESLPLRFIRELDLRGGCEEGLLWYRLRGCRRGVRRWRDDVRECSEYEGEGSTFVTLGC